MFPLTPSCHPSAAAWPRSAPSPAAAGSSSGTAATYLSAVSVATAKEHTGWSCRVK